LIPAQTGTKMAPVRFSFEWNISACDNSIFLALCQLISLTHPYVVILVEQSLSYLVKSQFWQLLTYTIGVGGSVFTLGLADGVVMMSIHPKLTFVVYARIVFLPALLSFIAGFVTIYLQYLVLSA